MIEFLKMTWKAGQYIRCNILKGLRNWWHEILWKMTLKRGLKSGIVLKICIRSSETLDPFSDSAPPCNHSSTKQETKGFIYRETEAQGPQTRETKHCKESRRGSYWKFDQTQWPIPWIVGVRHTLSRQDIRRCFSGETDYPQRKGNTSTPIEGSVNKIIKLCLNHSKVKPSIYKKFLPKF